MKNNNLIIISSVMFLLFSIASCTIFKSGVPRIKGEVDVDKVFDNIQKQYYSALKRLNLDGYDIDVKSSAITLSNIKTTSIGAKLKLLIITGGYKNIQKNQTSITFSLQPPPANKESFYDNFTLFDSSSILLANMIYKAAVEFSKIPNFRKLTDHVITIDIAFSVENDGSIELTGPLGAFTPDGTLEKDFQTGSEMKLVFGLKLK